MRICIILILVIFLSSCTLGPPILWVEDKSTESLLSFPEKNLKKIRASNFNGVSPVPQIIVNKNIYNKVIFCVRSYILKADVLYTINDAEVLVDGQPLKEGKPLNDRSNRCESYPKAKIKYDVNQLISYDYDTLHQMFKNGGTIQFNYVLEITKEGQIYKRKYSDELSAYIVRHSSW